ncbi:hypothetical protein CPHO_04880 [Corynebacterium phocae]|uniref:Peroxide stress protein YaaA n=1 Tax=Corynebacterium phocae TaxID=161895 RepID=A0A1L7D2M8_9CORY|nr:peroxide stress protein YaaA [Corynebacterium phocae]APT92333.1 hypothetical protein CPHO_04880 [Corynebacterium phocae]KAA8724924.1 peroxide stress protein YaaA [Corynebacterium phocae]
MLIILPPSETKAHGGTAAPLQLTELSFPRLTPARQEIADALSSLSVDEALETLKLSEKLRPEAESNQRLFSSPTMPAIERFTGVLYDALDASSLPASARAHLAVGDALFGLIRADDLIPHYRLSGNSKLEGRTMKSRWGKLISAELNELSAAGELVVDMRSGAYQNLGKCAGAITVRVESVQKDGSRKVVSHFNKHYKGALARVLAMAEASHGGIDTIGDTAAAASRAGLQTEIRGQELVLVV